MEQDNWHRKYTQRYLDNGNKFVFRLEGNAAKMGRMQRIKYRILTAGMGALFAASIWLLRRHMEKNPDLFRQGMARKK